MQYLFRGLCLVLVLWVFFIISTEANQVLFYPNFPARPAVASVSPIIRPPIVANTGLNNPLPLNRSQFFFPGTGGFQYCGGYTEVDCSSLCYYRGCIYYQCQQYQCYCF